MTASTYRTSTHGDQRLRIELLRPPALYYALVLNRVPIVHHLLIENLTDNGVADLDVSMELLGPDGPLAEPWSRHIPTITAHDSVGFDEFGDFSPTLTALRNTDESFPIDYRVIVRRPDSTELRMSTPSRVLAHNEWFSSPALYESIAAFVQPNTASVAGVLRAASELLERQTGSASLQGYQAGPKRATEIGAAVYEALRAQRITYVDVPASFEDTGQKVRSTAAVLRDRLGNCIDLSVTYTACLEAAGLNPLIWIIAGHAFAGFFLNEERLPEAVSLDAAQLINIVESDKALAVELTGIGVGDDSIGFAEATRLGRAHLRGNRELFGMVDIKVAHRSGIKPMPSAEVVELVPTQDGQASEPGQAFSLPSELEARGAFDVEENLQDAAAHDDAPPRVAAWRRALLDLSLRNPLLKLPKRGKGLELHVPGGSLARLDDLVHSGKAINIVAQDHIGGVHELQGVRRAQELPNHVLADELDQDRRVYGAVTQASYVQRMRSLQRDARTLEQETGSNYLYLTLGSLVHPTPTGEAHAPLFLLPVRIEGGTGHRAYTVLVDGDAVAAPNYCLVQWLRVKHGVQIPELQRPILDEHGIDIAASFRTIRKALVDNNLSYRVDESANLRLLQFSTFQMWRDLTNHWATFRQNAVVRHLAENPGKPMVDEYSGRPHVTVDEATLHVPIPADGSQLRAVAMAEQGHSFVLEGPPGTGKSQTITNLIAHAIQSGKTVLFVAEKQAALDVVKRRLTDIGLENFCLDLHGRRQSSRSIHQQLRDALEHEATADRHGWQATEAEFRTRIAMLRRYPEQLHRPNPADFSAWTAYEARLAYGDGPTAIIPAPFLALPQPQRMAAQNASRELVAGAESARLRPHHPWLISGRRDVAGLTPETLTDAARELEEVRLAFGRLAEPLRTRIKELHYPTLVGSILDGARLAAADRLPSLAQTSAAKAPEWDGVVGAAHNAVIAFQHQHRLALSLFRPEFFVLPCFDELTEQAKAANKGLFGKKKRRVGLLEAIRPHLVPSAQLDEGSVLPTFHAAAAARQAALSVAEGVRAVPGIGLPATWAPAQVDAARAIEATHHALSVSRELHDRLPVLWDTLAELGRQVPVTILERIVAAWTRWLQLLGTTDAEFAGWTAGRGWAASWDRDGPTWSSEIASEGLRPVHRWGVVLGYTEVLAQFGLTDFRRQILDAEFTTDQIELAFLRGVTRSALTERLQAEGLEYFNTGTHESHIDDYLRLADDLRDQLPDRLAAELVANRSQRVRQFSIQPQELVRLLNARRNRLSFRDACARYPDVITALTPCFLMSPASVANFLEPGAITFDIAVFDEASQIRVAQAIGAMGRARSVVVVGDSKQMPPTSVMEAANVDETDLATVPEDLDSILTECVESGLPQEWLSWHYRSADEALISFSNAHYYDGRLASLPTPGGDPSTGIFWRRVNGHFDRGTKGRRTNAVEAQSIVDEIARLLADPRTADRSIGVVTFNVQQRDLLLNLLEDSADGHIQAALARQDGEALFVKNLENVQGDERDVILFSLAFSKNAATGQLPLNFGPLIWQGGERRLNVAVTRARKQVILFSSFDPKDIDLARTKALGMQHLRAYLELAAGGIGRSGDVISHHGHRSDRIVTEIADELRARGHEVEIDFGLSWFTVDIAVRTLGSPRWQVAVLLDGPAWARRPTVADRDASPQLLSSLTRWPEVVRVWLPQWITDRASVLDRIDAAVAAATTEPEAAVVEVATPTISVPAPAKPEIVVFVPFVPTRVGTREQLNDLRRDKAVQQLVRASLEEAIAAEGPIEIGRLLRLVHNRFGWEKVHAARRELMLRYLPSGYLRTRWEGTRFVWPEHLHPDTWWGFRRNPNGSDDRAFDEIAPEEIANAMRQAFDTGQAREPDELHKTTMALLGYRRRSAAMLDTLDRVLSWGVTMGRLPGYPGEAGSA